MKVNEKKKKLMFKIPDFHCLENGLSAETELFMIT